MGFVIVNTTLVLLNIFLFKFGIPSYYAGSNGDTLNPVYCSWPEAWVQVGRMTKVVLVILLVWWIVEGLFAVCYLEFIPNTIFLVISILAILEEDSKFGKSLGISGATLFSFITIFSILRFCCVCNLCFFFWRNILVEDKPSRTDANNHDVSGLLHIVL